MLWIFAVIAVALVAIIVELLMVYQKRAHDLCLRQEPIRRSIREHVRGMEESTQTIRRTATQGLEELDYQVRVKRKQSEPLSALIRQVREDAGATVEEETTSAEQPVATAAAEDSDEPLEPQQPTRDALLLDATRTYDEIDGHITSLRREVEIVRRTMERIEARTTRRLGTKQGST
jgi:hypothetical protein